MHLLVNPLFQDFQVNLHFATAMLHLNFDTLFNYQTWSPSVDVTVSVCYHCAEIDRVNPPSLRLGEVATTELLSTLCILYVLS